MQYILRDKIYSFLFLILEQCQINRGEGGDMPHHQGREGSVGPKGMCWGTIKFNAFGVRGWLDNGERQTNFHNSPYLPTWWHALSHVDVHILGPLSRRRGSSATKAPPLHGSHASALPSQAARVSTNKLTSYLSSPRSLFSFY